MCPDPALVATAEAELLALPGVTLKDGRRWAVADTSERPAGWFEGVGTFVLDSVRRRILASSPPADPAEWEHRAVGWALPSLLGELGATVLHGCVVVSRGRAWILCARSGEGKTMTSLALRAAGMHLLSDDVAVVEAGTAQVAAGPRGSRVLGTDGTKTLLYEDSGSPAAQVPLAGLGVLNRRGASELHRRVSPGEAFVALLPHTCPVSEAALCRMTRHLADLARSLPILAVSMPDDLAALPAAASQLAEVLV